jgi:type 1 glutamine amidotransferase
MHERGAWTKLQGKGIILYFMPGHAASDYQTNGIAQRILKALRWTPGAAENH